MPKRPAGLLFGFFGSFHSNLRNVEIHRISVGDLLTADAESEFNLLNVRSSYCKSP